MLIQARLKAAILKQVENQILILKFLLLTPYGIMDTRDGSAKLTQAGHPSPILLQNGQKTSLIGTGGYPVAMQPDVDYEEDEIHFNKGDRLILYSDGITECTNNKKDQFSVERLIELTEQGRNLPLDKLMTKVQQSLRQWKGDDKFEDDVTLLAMEIL